MERWGLVGGLSKSGGSIEVMIQVRSVTELLKEGAVLDVEV